MEMASVGAAWTWQACIRYAAAPLIPFQRRERARRLAQVHLNEDEAIDVFLVRAIEADDTSGIVLTRDDRQYASAAALAQYPLTDRPASVTLQRS